MDNQQIAADLFSAFETGDMDTVRQLCAPQFRARQNLNNEFDVETLIQFSQAVSAIVKDFRYEDIIRSATDSGFVEEHTVRGTLPNGSQLTLVACVVADIENGKITRLREYVDTAAAAGLIGVGPPPRGGSPALACGSRWAVG